MSNERAKEATALEWAILNAIRIGMTRIDRKPEKSGHPAIVSAIENEELTWRDRDAGIVFNWDGREYAVHVDVEPLESERN